VRSRTPRGFVRLHKVNHQPGNLGFTIPIAMSRRMADAGQHEGDLYRAVLIPEGVMFMKVPDHSAPKEDTPHVPGDD
jgi:hypothetical protein